MEILTAEQRETLFRIAKEAGEAIMQIYEREDLGVETKNDDSPLTIADRRANAIICSGLENLSSKYPIISEENKEIEYADRKDFHRYWCVDPLDGTKEFIKRNGEFTVNIALIEDQKPVFGIIYVPVTKETFWAQKNHGSWHMIEAECCNRLTGIELDQKAAGLKMVCSRSHINDATQAFMDNYSTPEMVSKGSSLKFLILAKGDAHIYPRLGPTMEWDTAAAQAILEEAGGSVINHETGKALHYNKENLLNPYFIAYCQAQDN